LFWAGCGINEINFPIKEIKKSLFPLFENGFGWKIRFDFAKKTPIFPSSF